MKILTGKDAQGEAEVFGFRLYKKVTKWVEYDDGCIVAHTPSRDAFTVQMEGENSDWHVVRAPKK